MTINTMFLITSEVERLLNELAGATGDYCRNPITGASFVWGVDRIKLQKNDAVSALLAREYFAVNGPSHAGPLPLSPDEIEEARNAGGITSVVGFYARSLASRLWNVQEHPSPTDFLRGLMASDINGWGIAKDPNLPIRFPPRTLDGMGPDLVWRPPAEHTRYAAMVHRAKMRAAA
ncbi:MAG: hypothetical protein ACJ8EF_06630 [Bradyrhizobium sp.]